MKIKHLIVSAIATACVCLGGAFAPVVAFADEGVENSANSVEIVSSEEVVEETESVEISANDEVQESVVEESAETELTFDDILNFAGEIMEKEGYEDEWEKALYYIETAATEKKVDAMIILVAAVLALFVLDRVVKLGKWYKKLKTDTTSKDIKDIKTANGQQTSAINSLIDEEEKVATEVKDSIRREKALASATTKQNIAIRCLIRGTNIKQDLKDESFRALNESDDLCDEAKK